MISIWELINVFKKSMSSIELLIQKRIKIKSFKINKINFGIIEGNQGV